MACPRSRSSRSSSRRPRRPRKKRRPRAKAKPPLPPPPPRRNNHLSFSRELRASAEYIRRARSKLAAKLFFHSRVLFRIRRFIPALRVPQDAVQCVLVSFIRVVEIQRQRLLRPVKRLAGQLL